MDGCRTVAAPKAYGGDPQTTTGRLARVGAVSATATATDTVRGAYGFRLPGFEGNPLLLDVPADWPPLKLVQQPGSGSGEQDSIGSLSAHIRFRGGGDAVIERSTAHALLTVPRPLSDHELIHPYLAPIAAVAALWLGRESFHAGGVILHGGVWGVLGDRGAGKSSVLAWLASQGIGVFCDDVLVVGRERAFAGPRSVDLRAEPASRLGLGEPLGRIGARTRWRLTVGPVDLSLPLRGWMVLRWGPKPALDEISFADKLPLIIRSRALRVPPTDPGWMLELAALPIWEIRRPRDWNSIGRSAELLIQAAGVSADWVPRNQSD